MTTTETQKCMIRMIRIAALIAIATAGCASRSNKPKTPAVVAKSPASESETPLRSKTNRGQRRRLPLKNVWLIFDGKPSKTLVKEALHQNVAESEIKYDRDMCWVRTGLRHLAPLHGIKMAPPRIEIRAIVDDSVFAKFLYEHANSMKYPRVSLGDKKPPADRKELILGRSGSIRPSEESLTFSGVKAQTGYYKDHNGQVSTFKYVTAPTEKLLTAYVAKKLPEMENQPSDQKVMLGFGVSASNAEKYPILTYAVAKNIVLNSKDFHDVQMSWAEDLQQISLRIRLTADAANRFAAFSTRHVGKRMAIVADNWVMSAVTLMGPIKGGQIHLLLDQIPSALLTVDGFNKVPIGGGKSLALKRIEPAE